MAKVISTILSLKNQFSAPISQANNSTKQFRRTVQHTQNSINDMKQAINGAFKNVAMKAGGLVAGLGIANFAKESIMLASDLNEVQNVVDTTFGESANKINDFAKDAIKNLGLSELQAKQFSGTIGALAKGMGINGDALNDMSINLASLSGDFASFYNLEPAEAFEKIKAGIVGSSEPLLSLGIDMRDAALEAYALSKHMGKAWKDMSSAEKTQVRYNYLMEKGALASGDFKKTSAGFANQLRIVKNQISSLGANTAKLLLPYLEIGLQKVNNFIDVLPKFAKYLKDSFKFIGNATSANDMIQPIMDVFNDLVYNFLPRGLADFLSSALGFILDFGSNVIDNAIRIGKDLVNPFMDAFNSIKIFVMNRIAEITKLIDNTNFSKGMEETFNVLRDVLKDILGFVKDIFDFINNNWGAIKPLIEGIAIAFLTYKTYLLLTEGVLKAVTLAQGALNLIMTMNPIGFIIVGIGLLIGGLILLAKNSDKVKAWIIGQWEDFVGKYTAIWEGIKQAALNVWTGIKENMSNTWNGLIETGSNVWNGFKETLGNVWLGIKENLSNIWSGIGNVFSDVWNGIKQTASNVLNGIIDLINDVIGGINNLASFKIPNWIPGIGGKSFSLNIPEVPAFASGTSYFTGGLAQVNERGGELINLPNGSKIIPHDKTEKILKNTNGVSVYVIVQGNVIGNEEYTEYMANAVGNKVMSIISNS